MKTFTGQLAMLVTCVFEVQLDKEGENSVLRVAPEVGCDVKVSGTLPIIGEDSNLLSPETLDQIRVSCSAYALAKAYGEVSASLPESAHLEARPIASKANA